MFDFKPARLILTIVLTLVAIFGFDFLVHQILLAGEYDATKEVWRGAEEMKLPFMFLGQFLFAAVFSMLFARGFASGCWPCAIIFGGMMGLALGTADIVFYSVLPITGTLAAKWVGFGIVRGILLGVIAKLAYGKGPIDVKTMAAHSGTAAADA